MTGSDRRDAVPGGIDTSVPHPARRYNYWLGGKDNFEADRRSGDLISQTYPAIVVAARENRGFLQRAVRVLVAEEGVRQFLDVGTGLPTADNTHEVAQRLDPTARVVYVDNDPMVMAHARALLTSSPQGRTCYLEQDLRDPDAIVASPSLHETLDLGQPVALMLIAVLHFIEDHAASLAAVRRLVDALPAGSYLAVSVATSQFLDPAVTAALEQLRASGKSDIWGRTRPEFLEFLDGFDVLQPGVVPVSQWRTDLRPPGSPVPPVDQASVFAAVGRKR